MRHSARGGRLEQGFASKRADWGAYENYGAKLVIHNLQYVKVHLRSVWLHMRVYSHTSSYIAILFFFNLCILKHIMNVYTRIIQTKNNVAGSDLAMRHNQRLLALAIKPRKLTSSKELPNDREVRHT